MSRLERVLWAALLAVNVATHLVALDERALSHDESMHAFYSHELAKRGEYRHDPMMHGPYLFHSTALVFVLLGESDFTARLLQAVLGIGLVPALWLYRRYLGRAGALLAALLVTISPSILFYGRYARNDVPMAFFGLLWVYGALRYHDTRLPRFLYLMTAAMSISFCAKETAFLSGASFGTFFAARAAWRALRGQERLRDSVSAHVAVLMLTFVLPFVVALAHVAKGWDPADFDSAQAHARALTLVPAAMALSAVIAFAWCWRSGPLGLRFGAWLRLAGTFWAAPLVLFTTMFTNVPRGITSGIVGSMGYWLGQHGVARGGQPWFYYLMLAVVYEPLALLCALVGILLLLRRRTEPLLVPLCGWWMATSFVLYSVAGEKMPWLLVHIALPMSLLAAWTLSRVWTATSWPTLPRPGRIVLLALPVLAAAAAAPLFMLRPTGRSLEAAADATRVLTHVLILGALLVVAARVVKGVRARAAIALLALGGASLLGAYTLRSALRLTFVNGDLANELLVYAHGTPDLKRTLSEIREIAARTGEGDSLVVAYDDDSTWPLNWYLRDFHKQRYLGEVTAPADLLAPVVMIGSKNIGKAEPHLERDYVRREYRLIWWPPEDYMGFGPRDLPRLLADPGRRHRLWRYLLHRDTGYDLSDWPLRHDFTLFVRRDLASRAWPLGFEALASPATTAATAPRVECLVQKVIEGPFDGGLLQSPSGIAVAADGRRLIADTGGSRIVGLDRDDAFVRAFGTRCDLSKGPAGGCADPDGTGPLQAGDGQLLEPWGVAEGPDGGTLVADTWNGRLVVFDAEGRFVRAWGRLSLDARQPAEADRLYGPRGIAYDSERRRVAVADTGHKRVLIYSPDGLLWKEHGGPGKEAGRFDEPVGLAFGADGSLYVADAWNRRIQRFDIAFAGTGEWPASSWGSRAPADKPYVAVSRAGMVYASDPAGARVLVFAPDGTLSATIDGPGWSAPVRVRPTGLALDEARGLLLVADPAHNRVWSLAVSGKPDQPCQGR